MLIFCTLISFSQGFTQRNGTQPFRTSFAQPQPGVYEVTFEILNATKEEVTHNGVIYNKIDISSSTTTQKQGWPELPYVSAALQLPADKDVDIEVTPISSQTIQLEHPLVPSRGVIYRNQDPSGIPYTVDPASLLTANYPADIATIESPYIVRDVRGTSIRFYPFHYNALNSTVTFYSKVVVTLRENTQPATNPLTRINATPVKEAMGMYQSIFLNYEPKRDALSQGEKGDILVLTPQAYEAAADTFILWKKEMGYNVTKQVVSNGANVTSTIATAYGENPNLFYVQLFGDWDDIKSNTISADGESAPADPKMGCVAGSDNFPDITIGRFSCSSNAQALVQVRKAVNYEKNPNMDAGWRETFIGIGSAEGSGSGDDNEIDYTHIQRIYSERLDPFTYDTEKGNYGNSASASTLASHVNAGASTIAYCGHGDETYFVTTNYSNSNVNSSTNGDKLPFVVAVACVNGKFNRSGGDCFAEAWLKKENGGAVVTLMSTINQPWTPPQRGQDYFYDILVGGFDYTQYSGQSGINTNEQRTHWGSIVVNAFNLALTESSTSSDLETFRTWTTFGDASLQLRTKQPDAISYTSANLMMNVPFTTTITANGQPVADALVCISQNGEYLSAYTDAAGQVSIEHNFLAGDVLLVVTAFNTTTIYETIQCTPNNIPYLVLDDYTPEIVEFGQQPYLSLTLQNIGGEATTGNTTVTLSCDDPMLSFLDATENFGTMAANGGTATANNGFQLSIDNDVETGHVFDIDFTATCGEGSWTGSFQLTAIGSDCVAPTGLTATASGEDVVLSWDDNSTIETVTYTDDVEGHTYGTINSPGTIGWSYIDGDGASTGSFSGFNFTNEGSPMAFIVLDDSQISGTSNVTAHSGHKFFGDAYGVSGSSWYQTAVQNDDWLISPELNFGSPFTFSFYARSASSNYSAEQFYVAYSTSGANSSDFTNLSSQVTTTATWAEYSYTVPAEAKYVAIHCVSNNQYIFCVDDISIVGEVGNGNHYNLYKDGELIASDIFGGNYIDHNVTEGTHCYSLKVNCGSGFESAAATECVTVGTPVEEPCDAPTGLTTACSPNNISLVWESIPNAISYKIYRNNSILTTISNNYYTDNSVEIGVNYAYAVRAICNGGESALSNIVNAQTASGIDGFDAQSLRIFPNPANGTLHIENAENAEVALYTTLGEKVAQTELVGGRANLNVSALSNGIYLLRIVNGAGATVVRKVMIEH